jgi:hypothetical protein
MLYTPCFISTTVICLFGTTGNSFVVIPFAIMSSNKKKSDNGDDNDNVACLSFFEKYDPDISYVLRFLYFRNCNNGYVSG